MVKNSNMRISVTIPRSVAKELKMLAVIRDSSVSAVVESLIKKELQRKDN